MQPVTTPSCTCAPAHQHGKGTHCSHVATMHEARTPVTGRNPASLDGMDGVATARPPKLLPLLSAGRRLA